MLSLPFFLEEANLETGMPQGSPGWQLLSLALLPVHLITAVDFLDVVTV